MENETDNQMCLGRLVAWVKVGWVINCMIALALCAIIHADILWKSIILIECAVAGGIYLARYVPLLRGLSQINNLDRIVKNQIHNIFLLITAWIIFTIVLMKDDVTTFTLVCITNVHLGILLVSRYADTEGLKALAEDEYDCDIFIGCGCK